MTRSESLSYRPCAGVMLINSANQVFTGQRIDTSVEAWQMPQGGIDEGESPLQAARRELEEETGVTQAQLVAQLDDWLSYDLPEELIGTLWDGRYRGQKQKWFAFRLTAPDSHININTPHPEFRAWQWSNMQDLPQLIVPFKRALYEELVARFAPLLPPPAM